MLVSHWRIFFLNNFFYTLFQSCHFYTNWAESLGLVYNSRESYVDYDVRKNFLTDFNSEQFADNFSKCSQIFRFLRWFGVKINHFCITQVESFSIFDKTSLVSHNKHCRTTLVEEKKHCCHLTPFFPWKTVIFSWNRPIFIMKNRANISTLGL